MKGTAVVLSLILSVVALHVRAEQSSGDDFLLATGRAGRVELGTSVDEIYAIFGRENVRLVDAFKEGMFSPALQITLPGAAINLESSRISANGRAADFRSGVLKSVTLAFEPKAASASEAPKVN